MNKALAILEERIYFGELTAVGPERTERKRLTYDERVIIRAAAALRRTAGGDSK